MADRIANRRSIADQIIAAKESRIAPSMVATITTVASLIFVTFITDLTLVLSFSYGLKNFSKSAKAVIFSISLIATAILSTSIGAFVLGGIYCKNKRGRDLRIGELELQSEDDASENVLAGRLRHPEPRKTLFEQRLEEDLDKYSSKIPLNVKYVKISLNPVNLDRETIETEEGKRTVLLCNRALKKLYCFGCMIKSLEFTDPILNEYIFHRIKGYFSCINERFFNIYDEDHVMSLYDLKSHFIHDKIFNFSSFKAVEELTFHLDLMNHSFRDRFGYPHLLPGGVYENLKILQFIDCKTKINYDFFISLNIFNMFLRALTFHKFLPSIETIFFIFKDLENNIFDELQNGIEKMEESSFPIFFSTIFSFPMFSFPIFKELPVFSREYDAFEEKLIVDCKLHKRQEGRENIRFIFCNKKEDLKGESERIEFMKTAPVFQKVVTGEAEIDKRELFLPKSFMEI